MTRDAKGDFWPALSPAFAKADGSLRDAGFGDFDLTSQIGHSVFIDAIAFEPPGRAVLIHPQMGKIALVDRESGAVEYRDFPFEPSVTGL
jgi:hypothetical protein